jgi:hypothetical protein
MSAFLTGAEFLLEIMESSGNVLWPWLDNTVSVLSAAQLST